MTHDQFAEHTNLMTLRPFFTGSLFGKFILTGLICCSLVLAPSSYAINAENEETQTKVFDMVLTNQSDSSEEFPVTPPSIESQDAHSEQDPVNGVEEGNAQNNQGIDNSEIILEQEIDSVDASTGKKVEAAPDNRTTAEKLEDLKEEVLAVNRDLFILEEDLLFPASTQVAAYFSIDIGYFFSLDNIKVKIDDKQVTHYLYTKKDVDALYRGAIQKVYLGNVSTGEHEMVAILIGHGPHNREYRVAVNYTFEKGTEAKALEIQLRDDTGKLQPKLNLVEW
ncbi:MAG: hypothetical protein L3J46_05850 [Kangiellaceae bacterium]|nr:hypothetical protein [Kangiellaceae bacterium]